MMIIIVIIITTIITIIFSYVPLFLCFSNSKLPHGHGHWGGLPSTTTRGWPSTRHLLSTHLRDPSLHRLLPGVTFHHADAKEDFAQGGDAFVHAFLASIAKVWIMYGK